MVNYKIAPSILSADFSKLGEEVDAVVRAGADMIHIDVMDNHYVPNLTFGPMVCKSIRPITTLPLDVHLMAAPVDRLAQDFAKAGANIITFHPEATDHVDRTIQIIQDSGCKAGIVINPATSIGCLDWVLDKISVVLIMSVNPGFGGQEFIQGSYRKIKRVRKVIQESGREISLQVDGGINAENIKAIAKAGADSFVSGSAIFGASDYHRAIANLKQQLL